MRKWGDMAVVSYLEEYVRECRGRGLPEMYDAEIASSCQGTTKAAPEAEEREPPARKGRQGSEQPADDMAMSEQLAELLKAQATMVSTVNACTSQISSLQSEVAKMKNTVASLEANRGGGGGPFVDLVLAARTCHKCGKKGRLAANCPDKEEKEK